MLAIKKDVQNIWKENVEGWIIEPKSKSRPKNTNSAPKLVGERQRYNLWKYPFAETKVI